MTAVQSTTRFLRFIAILQMLMAGIVCVPLSWIAWWHAWLGLGLLPDDAALRYVIRGGAWVQGAIGVLLWIVATDVVRYRPLVVATAAIYLLSGPAFYVIESVAGMPRFWCILDAASCFAVGAILFTLCRYPPAPGAEKSQPFASLNAAPNQPSPHAHHH